MDVLEKHLRSDVKREFHAELLLDGSWLISTYPMINACYTPCAAFSSFDEMIDGLRRLVGPETPAKQEPINTTSTETPSVWRRHTGGEAMNNIGHGGNWLADQT